MEKGKGLAKIEGGRERRRGGREVGRGRRWMGRLEGRGKRVTMRRGHIDKQLRRPIEKMKR